MPTYTFYKEGTLCPVLQRRGARESRQAGGRTIIRTWVPEFQSIKGHEEKGIGSNPKSTKKTRNCQVIKAEGTKQTKHMILSCVIGFRMELLWKFWDDSFRSQKQCPKNYVVSKSQMLRATQVDNDKHGSPPMLTINQYSLRIPAFSLPFCRRIWHTKQPPSIIPISSVVSSAQHKATPSC